MDLRSDNPYWLFRKGIPNIYPSLQQNVHADVTVMGGGITGALITWYLNQAGFSVNVVDKRHIGFGSTAACTGLLQYEIDTPLHELIDMIGEKDAVRSYELCLEALEDIRRIAANLKSDIGYAANQSLQFASFKSHCKNLKKEFETRKKFGIGKIEWLESSDIENLFGFNKSAAIMSKEGAVVDAYALTHALFENSIQDGRVKIFDNTLVESIKHGRNKVELITSRNNKLTSRYLVIACGYESQNYLSKQVEISNSTYAIVSEPFDKQHFWHQNAMIWETADPYLYLRTTNSNRLIIGGKDDQFYNPAKRDARVASKKLSLEKAFAMLFPSIEFRSDFAWAGYFGRTKDGLPYIGSVPERPNTYFALGYGGNGVIFSVIAARIIRDSLSGKKNQDQAVFSFER